MASMPMMMVTMIPGCVDAQELSRGGPSRLSLGSPGPGWLSPTNGSAGLIATYSAREVEHLLFGVRVYFTLCYSGGMSSIMTLCVCVCWHMYVSTYLC